MSLHEAVEIKQREADLRTSGLRKLAASGLGIVGMIMLLGITWNNLGDRPHPREAYAWVLIGGSGLYLAYLHHRNGRRIDALELELLKLRRELSFKEVVPPQP